MDKTADVTNMIDEIINIVEQNTDINVQKNELKLFLSDYLKSVGEGLD
jgi:hypothetical protein